MVTAQVYFDCQDKVWVAILNEQESSTLVRSRSLTSLRNFLDNRGIGLEENNHTEKRGTE